MRLRNQLVALSVLTLLLPWAGWQLLGQLENFLRQGEESALLASANTIAKTLPSEYQTDLKLARGRILPLRQFVSVPVIDGFESDWPETAESINFSSSDDLLKLSVLAGHYRAQLFLLMNVEDAGSTSATTFNTGTSDESQRAGIMLYLQNNRSQQAYMLATEAPGELTVISQGEGKQRLQAAWQNTVNGYRVELVLPADVERISIGAVTPSLGFHGVSADRQAGTLNGRQQGEWLELASRQDAVPRWLATVLPVNARAWLVQSDAWVVADSGIGRQQTKSQLTWIERVIYQLVANSDMPLRDEPAEWPVRLSSVAVAEALKGGTGMQWNRDQDSAVVYNLVAVPVLSESQTIGAVVLEARSEGLLLMTNRALGRLLFVTLLVVTVLGGGLWLFASRLSRRVQKLSAAVNQAMDTNGERVVLPQTASKDELGDLARNTEKLLKAVADYTGYLQKLAGRLSHELKTPIAITRSSLENLSTQPLDPQARQYLQRATDGLDRQSAIVRAMSEAQRLEGAVKSADWETVDMGDMLSRIVAGYQGVHACRQIGLSLPSSTCLLHCAPELIVQALDKLVDNAVGLSAPDGVIDISLAQDKSDYLLTVANSGTRLPEVESGQLFDSLVSLRDKAGGGQHLGLGLYIVRLVVEAHAGGVSAHNLPDNKGVEFIIRLPTA